MIRLIVWNGTNDKESNVAPWYSVTRRMTGERYEPDWYAPRPVFFVGKPVQISDEVQDFITRASERNTVVFAVGELRPGGTPDTYCLTIWTQAKRAVGDE